MSIKPLPTRVAELMVPNRAYRYFEDAGRSPFVATARQFSPLNAWWLAEASFLSYVREPSFVAERLLSAGFASVKVFEKRATTGFVAQAADWACVFFRGTDVSELDNLLTDISFLLTEAEGQGRVHRGFQAALDLIWEPMNAQLGSLGDRPVWFTGHSLGGALATLAARRFGRAAGLCTFGSPRVGDADWCASHAIPTWRVVHHLDLVAFLPPPLRYRHVGEVIVILEDGTIVASQSAWERLKLRMTALLAVQGAAALFQPGGFARLLTKNSLADHAPIGYAVKLWNAHWNATRQP